MKLKTIIGAAIIGAGLLSGIACDATQQVGGANDTAAPAPTATPKTELDNWQEESWGWRHRKYPLTYSPSAEECVDTETKQTWY